MVRARVWLERVSQLAPESQSVRPTATPPREASGEAAPLLGPRVALDASFLALNRASGLRTYTANLVEALVATQGLADLVLFYLYWRGLAPRPFIPGTRERVIRSPRRPVEWSWRRLGLPCVDWLTGPVDVFHSVHALVPPQHRGASVLTVHDLREYRLPELFPHLQSTRAVRSAMARKAHRVVAISESTRRDAIELMDLAPERVRVVPNGLDPRFLESLPSGAICSLKERLGLKRPYVLFLSSGDPRKGMEEACEAFRIASSRGLAGFDLVVAGYLPPNSGDFLRAAGDPERVRVLGVVGDGDLRALLEGARTLLFPSRYEGFGLPLLEAFARRTPVVACLNSSIPEVAGDAALLVPTGDAEGLAEALERLESDGELRRALVDRGSQRCREFTWERAARLMLQVYREAADKAC